MIEPIESADDPRLDLFRHVADPHWLRQRGLFVAEGRLVLERVLALDRFAVQSILVNRAAHAALLDLLSHVDVPVFVCDDPTLQSITGYNFHRGCLALVARPPDVPLDALYDARRLLGVEGIANPDNIGGLFRTAAAFGIDGVVLDAASADPLYRKTIRTSMGASLRVPYARARPWLPALANLRERGFTLVALTPAVSAKDLSDFAAVEQGPRLIVLVGAEGTGLDAATIALADVSVQIPIDSSVDSLNVVVATGIALHRMCK